MARFCSTLLKLVICPRSSINTFLNHAGFFARSGVRLDGLTGTMLWQRVLQTEEVFVMASTAALLLRHLRCLTAPKGPEVWAWLDGLILSKEHA